MALKQIRFVTLAGNRKVFDGLKIAVAVIVLVVAAHHLVRSRASAALMLLFVLFFMRFVLASFHSITYPPLLGSFSLMSLASLASLGACFLLLPLIKPRGHSRWVMSKSLITVYLLIVLMVISALVNNAITDSLPSLIKWLYLLQLVSLIAYALTMDGLRNTLKVVLLAYSFPVVMLLLSIAMGVSKRSELDGSISFVGGFFHEAVFSTVIFTAAFFTITYLKVFSKPLPIRKNATIGLALVMFFSLMLFVNYRTSIIAFILMAAALALFTAHTAKASYKALFCICVAMLALWGAVFDIGDSSERFADIPNAYNNASHLITYPENYTRDERRLFSGRLYMWSAYISEANEGSTQQLLIGQGMGSWKKYFEKYAHNTFVSFYFELGFVGLILCVLIFLTLYSKLIQIADQDIRATASAFLLGFLVLNMSTMPMWSMEGIYCLAFLLALGRAASTKCVMRARMVSDNVR